MQRALGQSVSVGVHGLGDLAGNGTNVDDARRIPFRRCGTFKAQSQRARKKVRRLEIHLKHFVPSGLQIGLERRNPGGARIVHQHIKLVFP